MSYQICENHAHSVMKVAFGLQVSTAALGNGNDPYETVWRSLFWLAVALVAVTVLVTAAVAFFLYKRWQLPIILQSPRPQIMLLMFGVPAIAQSSAGKLQSP